MSTFTDCHDYSNISLNDKHNNDNDHRSHNEEVTKVKSSSLWTVYDYTVGNRTIKGPDKPGSYSILNLPEVSKQLILTWGESVEEAYEIMENFENVKPLCIVNCLNYGDPKYSLHNFRMNVQNMNNHCEILNIPIVGGNVSLYNTTEGRSIPPTPIIVMLGITT